MPALGDRRSDMASPPTGKSKLMRVRRTRSDRARPSTTACSRNFFLEASETEARPDQPFLLMCPGQPSEAAQPLCALEPLR